MVEPVFRELSTFLKVLYGRLPAVIRRGNLFSASFLWRPRRSLQPGLRCRIELNCTDYAGFRLILEISYDEHYITLNIKNKQFVTIY